MIDSCAEETGDAALVEAARLNPEDFGCLYDRYVQRVYRYALARCTSHADAEDITAQTFYRSLERLESYEWRGVPFVAWLYRIAHNLIVDRARRGGRDLSLDGLADAGAEPAGDVDGRDFDVHLSQQEALDAAWQMVGTLPLMQQRAVTLYFAHGLSHGEVGRAIGRSESATKQLVYRAVQTLRVKLVQVEQETHNGNANGC